ncbi:hypothetical protein [Amycolatopsis orientalis]|uniref:hypothetical protein n=1 Tax=Amycolatopsis orientalis TaxID=31958 RepID=UPI0003A5FAE9|nr:hypothetical protein [Amycolatopsis orientalis]
MSQRWRDNEGSAATQQALAGYLDDNGLPDAALRACQFVMLLTADTTDLILGTLRRS